MNELLPTFDLPTTAIIGLSGFMNCDGDAADVMNVAFLIIIVEIPRLLLFTLFENRLNHARNPFRIRGRRL